MEKLKNTQDHAEILLMNLLNTAIDCEPEDVNHNLAVQLIKVAFKEYAELVTEVKDELYDELVTEVVEKTKGGYPLGIDPINYL